MTLNSPDVQFRLGKWQDELREITGRPDAMLLAYEPLRMENGNTKVPLQDVIDTVCEETGVRFDEITRKTRKREVVIARQLICYFGKSYTGLSLKKIGEIIGGRDHTTVIHSVNTISDLLYSRDAAVCVPVANINKRLSHSEPDA